MMAEDEDALFCDFAETYHVIGFEELPVETAARLAAGLRDDSRIRSKLAGLEQPLDTLLLANIIDVLQLQLWAQTKDGHKGRNRPKSIARDMVTEVKDIRPSATPEEFKAIRARILGG